MKLKPFLLRLVAVVAISSLAGCVVAPAPDRGVVYYQRTTPYYEEPPSTYYYYQPAPRVEYVGPSLWPFLWFGAAWHWSEHRHGGRNYYRGGGRRH